MRLLLTFAVSLATAVIVSTTIAAPPPSRVFPPELVMKDGAVMVLVPAGQYYVGSGSGPANSRPEHMVEVPAFYIDRSEVTNARYVQFCRETGHAFPNRLSAGKIPRGEDDAPVVNVSYDDAEAYAAWTNKKIPSEAEWESAARGFQKYVYPWGNKYKPAAAIKLARPAIAESHKEDVSPFGVYDMAGNVMEWTRDWFRPYSVARNPSYKVGKMVVKGASYKSSVPADCRAFLRCPTDKTTRSPYIGFRCVREITP